MQNTIQTQPETLSKLQRLEAHLRERIRGQNHVLPRIVSVLQRGELGITKPERPKGSFLLLGPTGVGKTEVTLAFTSFLLTAQHVFRFDMSEYQTQERLPLLLGSSATERGMLAMVYERSRVGTLLFDEIEKAHPRVLDLSLQILDAARVTIATGETLDLSGYYVVFHVQYRLGRIAEPSAFQSCHVGAARFDAGAAVIAPGDLRPYYRKTGFPPSELRSSIGNRPIDVEPRTHFPPRTGL
jgi:hypothetical protein